MKRIFGILLLVLVMFSCQDKTSEHKQNVRHVQKVAYYYAETDLPWIIYYYDVVGEDSTWVEEKWFHENGVLQLEGEIVDNQREGEFKGYYPSGKLMSTGTFVKGLREGKGIVYHENGQVSIDGQYKGGEMVGIWKFYDEDGNVIDVKEY